MDHPARYALVEIENIHDQGLEFEPIHRVLFQLTEDPRMALNRYFGPNLEFEQANSTQEMKADVDRTSPGEHHFGLVHGLDCYVGKIKNPQANLPVGSLQPVLDMWLKDGGAGHIDYVHGDATVFDLGSQPGNAGFYLAGMAKNELFRTVILDGALPRKTFSLGEAHEKRFYIEARKIIR